MAALDFPASPTDGQIFSAPNGVAYQWSAAKGLWLALGMSLGLPQVIVAGTSVTWAIGTALADITPFTVSITPRNAASRFKIDVNLGRVAPPGSGSLGFVLTRDNSPICIGDAAGSRPRYSFMSAIGGDGNHASGLSWGGFDAPATAAPITYRLQGAAQTGSGYINRSQSDSDGAGVYQGRTYSQMIVSEILG